jgi:endonuclease YncB( thermonuclease family)
VLCPIAGTKRRIPQEPTHISPWVCKDPGFREATHANNLLVGGKEVRLEFGPRRTEKHERLIAYVYVGRMLVQAELVKQGWAIVTRAQSLPRYREVLQKYQEEAKAAARGSSHAVS